jgi:hypothetical protein
MRQVFTFLIPILLLSGCLSERGQEIHIPQIVEQKWENNSYQFWNVAPMSMGNTTVLSFNEAGSVSITVELDVYFHESLLWDSGYLNYTLINENETVFSHQLSEGNIHFQINILNVSNLTIQIQASGSDNTTDEDPGDWFTTQTYCEMKK